MSAWTEVCRAEDIPFLEGRRVSVDGFHVAVFHTEEGFFAVGDVCPHMGGPLSDGDVAATTVSCPLHARKIELKTGEVTNDDLSRAPIFPVEVENGSVLLDASFIEAFVPACRVRDEEVA
ncbi:MAG: nitrite reductase small subunit NirD [Rubrobacter sp.]|nr:nitrite reductase small subunit NirD [Rubrobacter sp.]